MAESYINGLTLCQGAIEGVFGGDADVAEHCEQLLRQPWFATDMRNKAAPHGPALFAIGKTRKTSSGSRGDDEEEQGGLGGGAEAGGEPVEYLLVGKATYDLFNTLKEVFSPRADDVLSVELRASADSDLRLKWATVDWRVAARVPVQACQDYVSDRLGYCPRFNHLILKRDACCIS